MERALSPPSVLSGTHPSLVPLPPPHPSFPAFPPPDRKQRDQQEKRKNKPNGQKQGHNKQKQSREQQQQQATHRSQYACVAVSANLCKKNKKADSTLGTSQAVPHPSTIRALCHLTSEVGRDPVYLTRYGRQRIRKSTKHLKTENSL